MEEGDVTQREGKGDLRREEEGKMFREEGGLRGRGI